MVLGRGVLYTAKLVVYHYMYNYPNISGYYFKTKYFDVTYRTYQKDPDEIKVIKPSLFKRLVKKRVYNKAFQDLIRQKNSGQKGCYIQYERQTVKWDAMKKYL